MFARCAVLIALFAAAVALFAIGDVAAEGEATPMASPDAIAREIDDGPGGEPLPAGRIEITAYQCLQQGFALPDEVAAFDPAPAETGDDGIVGNLPEEVYAGDDEFAGCTPDRVGQSFEIAVRNMNYRNQTVMASGNPAKAVFASAFAEPLYITSPTPDGFRRDPTVVCTSSLNGPMRFSGATSDYGIVQYDLEVDEVLVCNWYVVQLQAPGTIAITTRFCPDGMVPDDRAALVAACTDVLERIEISASRQGGQVVPFTGIEGDGTLRFDGVAPGSWTLTQRSLGLFDDPAVFCRSSTAGMPAVNRWFAMETFGSPANAVTVSVEADTTVACQWYVAKNGFVRFAEGNTILMMNFGACPATLDPDSASIYDFAQFCHDVLPPITATIAQPNGATMSATADSTDFNALAFEFIAGAPVVTTVDTIAGYARVIPFCDPRLDGIPGNGPMAPLPVSGPDLTVFTVPLQPDTAGITRASCSVYYMLPRLEDDLETAPVGDNAARALETGSIVITVHGCPMGTETTDTTLAEACVEPMPNLVFTALSTADEQVTAESSGDVIASAAFEALPVGAWVITVADTPQYPEGVAVCDGVSTVVTDGAATVTVAPGQTVVCDWYLVPSSRIGERPGGAAMTAAPLPTTYAAEVASSAVSGSTGAASVALSRRRM